MGVSVFFKCSPKQSEGFHSALIPNGKSIELIDESAVDAYLFPLAVKPEEKTAIDKKVDLDAKTTIEPITLTAIDITKLSGEEFLTTLLPLEDKRAEIKKQYRAKFYVPQELELNVEETQVPKKIYVFRNSKEVYRDFETVITHVFISNKLLKQLTSDIDGATDPFSVEGLEGLGLSDTYCGQTYTADKYTGLFWFCPELAGTKVIGKDEDNNDIDTDIVLRHSWAGAEI